MPTVQFMSHDAALELTEPTRILRVGFAHSNYQPFTVEHKDVQSVFVDPDARIPDETCQKIVEFMEAANEAGDDIVVHCTEGKYRSRAIANFAWRFFEGYEQVGKDWNGTEMRDNNYKSLYNWHKANRPGKA